jgi:hypothetical protein
MSISKHLIILLLLATPVFADDLCQFKGVPFGTNKKEILEKIMEFDPNYITNIGNSYYIREYAIGERVARLNLDFDDNDKFCRFRFDFEKYAANRLDDIVVENLAFIAATFKKKYGKPLKTFKVKRINIIFHENDHVAEKWKNKKCTANIGISHYESEFHAFADASDDKLSSEQTYRDSKKEDDSLKQAIKDF